MGDDFVAGSAADQTFAGAAALSAAPVLAPEVLSLSPAVPSSLPAPHAPSALRIPSAPPALHTPSAPSTIPELSPAPHAASLLAEAEALLARACEALEPLVEGIPSAESVLLEAVERAERTAAIARAVGKRASVAFRAARVRAEREAGVPAEQRGRGVRAELGLARRISPARAGNELALDRVVVESLPRTFGLLARGEISEWASNEVAKAVIVLDDADRAQVDADIAAELPAVSAPRAGSLARARANELDVRAALARNERQREQRHVTIRPVADGMVRLSALLPTVDGVAIHAALDREASAAKAAGIPGTRAQHRADALVRLATGLQSAEHIDVEIQLLMTDRTLLAGGDDTAWIQGHPVPGAIARRFALVGASDRRSSLDPDPLNGPSGAASTDPDPDPAAGARIPRRFIRRLYTDPVTGSLREADARRRRFTGADRRFVEIADQRCRMPWCEAPIRHLDHVTRHSRAGATEIANGAGLCEQCNYTEELPGWASAVVPAADPRERILEITTPTGRRYRSAPPPLRRGVRISEGREGPPPDDRAPS